MKTSSLLVVAFPARAAGGAFEACASAIDRATGDPRTLLPR